MEDLKEKEESKTLNHLLSIPFIYGCSIGLFALDIFVELYHRVCFPLYGIPYVKRGDYFRFDRAKLEYLTTAQKFNCFYCSYGNGLMKYCSEIVARTEKYWCGIQHQKDPDFIAPEHHKNFVEYNDAEGFKKSFNKY